jgi:hypothetical protein
MSPSTACPIARAEAGLAAIFAACEANKARQAEARRASAAGQVEGRRFWWQDLEERDTIADHARDTRP